MVATEKIISIMTRWRRCDFVRGDQIVSEDSLECQPPFVLEERTHCRAFNRRRLSKHSSACEQEECEGEK
jgi:hypothetical protein